MNEIYKHTHFKLISSQLHAGVQQQRIMPCYQSSVLFFVHLGTYKQV